MKLKSVSIKNFRCYREEVTVAFEDLTTFIGKNDIGKSSVLEALEIFFNNDTVKIESGDACIYGADKKVTITCEFTDVPETITSEDVTLLARHPTEPAVSNLLDLKEKDLQAIVKERKLEVALKGNPGMRRAILASEPDLKLNEVAIPLSKGKEDGKRIWDQLQAYLPMFALFQSDRDSKDSDGEVQTPMMAAVAQAIAEVQDEIDGIQKKVREKAEAIAHSTHQALMTIDPTLARELTPQFTAPTPAKWRGLFSVNMETDDGIPLNKRGSGIRRLILVSFFKAAAERRLASGDRSRSVIYAIEEPETGQHPNNQKILIDSFKTLADQEACQVILTTHSPGFAAELPVESIRYVTRDANARPDIQSGVDVFDHVATALGLVADSRVKVILCVEGPTDVTALKALSRAINQSTPGLPDLHVERRVAFAVLGGSTLQHWVTNHYLRELGRPEVHIYDSDVAAYAASVAEVNARTDGSWAAQTNKLEIENYLHADAIHEAFGVVVTVPDQLDGAGNAVPRMVSLAIHATNPMMAPMKDSNIKKRLADLAFPRMTAQRLAARDPAGEVAGWLQRIAVML